MAASFLFSFGASAHRASFSWVVVLCAFSRRYIGGRSSGFRIRSFASARGSRLPEAPEFPFRFSLFLSRVRFAALRWRTFLPSSYCFFSRGDSRLPGAPESPLFFLSTLASFEVMFPPGCTQWPCLCVQTGRRRFDVSRVFFGWGEGRGEGRGRERERELL